jgi:hypothetical protein
MWSIPDWLPAALFGGFWGILFVCGVWDLLRNK